MHEKDIRFSDKAGREMSNLMAAIEEIMSITFDSFLHDDVETAYRVEPLEQVIDRICRRMKERHTARLQKGKCTIINGYIFNDLIADFERISDHCSNIAIVIVELKDNALDVHELSDQIKQDHPHHFEEYYEEFQAKYLRKKDEAPA
jgi:phosphate:Na+ symporter